MLWLEIPTGTPPVVPPALYLGFVPRTASTSFAIAILQQFYPDGYLRWQSNMAKMNGRWLAPQLAVPATIAPKAPPATLAAVIREPLDRFRSGFHKAANGRTVDEMIALMQWGKVPVDTHIQPISMQVGQKYLSTVQWYRFDRDLSALATVLGLNSTPAPENVSDEGDKPTLTDAQTAALQAYYATDLAIYNACTAPGTTYTP